MSRPQLRTTSLPAPGSYLAGTGHTLDAVAQISGLTAAGPVHLRLPVLSAALIVTEQLRGSWFEADLDVAAATCSLPWPLGRSVERLVATGTPELRLETFALEKLADGRFRVQADLWTSGDADEVTLDARLVEVGPGSVRLVLSGRLPTATFGPVFGRLLLRPLRMLLAVHASHPDNAGHAALPEAV